MMLSDIDAHEPTEGRWGRLTDSRPQDRQRRRLLRKLRLQIGQTNHATDRLAARLSLSEYIDMTGAAATDGPQHERTVAGAPGFDQLHRHVVVVQRDPTIVGDQN